MAPRGDDPRRLCLGPENRHAVTGLFHVAIRPTSRCDGEILRSAGMTLVLRISVFRRLAGDSVSSFTSLPADALGADGKAATARPRSIMSA